ncbi:MAG: hypothetical protein J6Y93_00980 [Treponema sp.]|nr:hypothetical protein [Treponema sp.]
MVQSEITLYAVKLLLGAVAAFLAILLWSRTRDAAWMSLVAGAVTGYAGLVYEMLEKIGIITGVGITLWGHSLSTWLFAIVPGIFIIIAFAILLSRSK